MSTPSIVAEHLTRDFVRRTGVRRSTLRAVDDLTLTMQRGESLGYIGANGAGKSTTIKMLAGILTPTSGTVRTCGLDPLTERRRLAARLGVVFGQRSQLWWDLPVRVSFDILASVHRLTPDAARTRRAELVEALGLDEFWTTPVRQLSLGQRMRAEIAAALQHRPELLVLDEPTIGLDVVSKQRLREFLVTERAERGTSLLLTTHDMGDVARLCERVLVVHRGRAVHDGPMAGLAAVVGAERRLVLDLAEPSGPLALGALGTSTVEPGGRRHVLTLAPGHSVSRVVAALGEQGHELVDLTVTEPDAEELVRAFYERAEREHGRDT